MDRERARSNSLSFFDVVNASLFTITRQAELPQVSCGTVYYFPRPVSEADLALMLRIDKLHQKHPFMGARMLRDQLAGEGIHVLGPRLPSRLGVLKYQSAMEKAAELAARIQEVDLTDKQIAILTNAQDAIQSK